MSEYGAVTRSTNTAASTATVIVDVEWRVRPLPTSVTPALRLDWWWGLI